MTLTEISYYSRKLLPFAIIAFLLMLILYYTGRLIFLYYDLNRPKIVFTNPVFGKIPPPVVSQASSSGSFKFVLDTIEGQPVTATEAAKIYFMPETLARFGYREKIYLIAKNLGFDTTVVKHRLVNKEAIFNDGKKTLSLDITNFNFYYKVEFEDEPDVVFNTRIPFKQEIENKTVEFLKNIGRYPEELAKGKSNIIYLDYNQPMRTMTIVTQPRQANMVEVDFYRPDIDQFPIVSPTYFNSQNYVIMVFYENMYRVLKAQIRFFEKSEEQFGVYPIKSGNQAWEELSGGKAIIISSPTTGNQVVIKKMFFGYYDPDLYQPYLQPVYIFLGENNFVGYVPAVSNEYLTQ